MLAHAQGLPSCAAAELVFMCCCVMCTQEVSWYSGAAMCSVLSLLFHRPVPDDVAVFAGIKPTLTSRVPIAQPECPISLCLFVPDGLRTSARCVVGLILCVCVWLR